MKTQNHIESKNQAPSFAGKLAEILADTDVKIIYGYVTVKC